MYDTDTHTWLPWPKHLLRQWLRDWGDKLPRDQRKRYLAALEDERVEDRLEGLDNDSKIR